MLKQLRKNKKVIIAFFSITIQKIYAYTEICTSFYERVYFYVVYINF